MAPFEETRWWIVVPLVAVAALIVSGWGWGPTIREVQQSADVQRYEVEDGDTLLVSWHTGPCSRELVDEQTHVEETRDAVAVEVELTFRGQEPEWAERAWLFLRGRGRGCTDEGLEGCAVIVLSEPLGQRDVTDADGASIPRANSRGTYACDVARP